MYFFHEESTGSFLICNSLISQQWQLEQGAIAPTAAREITQAQVPPGL
jgi:hypothetical protein